MASTDALHVRALVQAMHKIIRYLGAFRNREAFLQNEMAQDAVTRNFEILGATARRVSSATQTRYPDLPWAQLASFHHTPLQEQYPIEPAILWEIASEQLPQYILTLEGLQDKL